MATKDFISGKGLVIPITELAPPSALGKSNRIYLAPGEFHVSACSTQITTILGSCVAICLWDSRNRVGGMNHYLFPEWHQGEGPSNRFGDLATAHLLAGLLDMGSVPKDIKAKVFGGAALFANPDRYATSLGAKNVAAAHRMMAQASIPIIGQDTGGQHGRKIIFDTSDCSAWSRKV